MSDCRRVEAALDRLDEPVCKAFPGIIAVWAQGRCAAVIHPGWIEWPQSHWSTDLPPALFPQMQIDARRVVWHAFDAFQDRTEPERARDRIEHVCPHCLMALPATGAYDYCL